MDSFFDITYRIDFVGRAGGPFGVMSGSTGTIRMQTGHAAVAVPTVSEWGLAILTLIGLVAGTILFSRKRSIA